MEILKLAELIDLQDAIDSHGRNWPLETHLICYKPIHRERMTEAYNKARSFIAEKGTVRRALNAIERQIEEARQELA